MVCVTILLEKMNNFINTAIFLCKRLVKENWKTIRFNFKYFPFKDAIKFPVLISKNAIFKLKEGGSIRFECPLRYGLVKIGYGKVAIFDEKFSRSIFQISGELVFKGNAAFGQGSKVSVAKNAKVIFGNKFIITAESEIVCSKRIEFGENCLLSWDILIMDSDHHIIWDQEKNIINHPKEIVIEDNVWIGCRASILKGSGIPSNSVIAANAVVAKNLQDPNAVYAGNPARKIKENITWG
jgi:acetyltransferase-like isoleucine patch superfamily enzyme